MGLRGHMTLIEGINSGSAKVIVKLPHAEYNHVSAVEVDITVLANLIIDPVDVHILVGDSINFKVLQLKQGKLHEVTLGPQYYLEIESKDLAEIDKGLATGLKLGTTNVILRDKNVIESSSNPPSMPGARLTVSEAAKITIAFLPYNNWVTVEQEEHEIGIDLYTKNNEKITLGTRYSIESSFDRDLYKESKRTVNGSRIAGLTMTKGTSLVTGKFNDLQANAELIIHRKIDLIPKLVILPYDANKPVNQRIQFHASGGDNSFSWFSGNPSLVTMTSDGIAETHLERFKDNLHHEGGVVETSIRAAMSRNTKIFKSAYIIFLPPIKLEIVAYNFETAINDFIDVHIALFAMYDNKLMPYTSCENLSFDIEFSSQILTIASADSDHTEKMKNACRVIRLKAIHAGLTSLTVSYRHGNDILKDDVQLLVNEKLIIFNPESNEIVLPVGSSRNVIYQYGARKTYAVGSELNKILDYSKSLIDVSDIKADFQDQRFGYNVLCRKVGETKVRVEIFNSLNQDNFIKNAAVIETKVFCVKPRFIHLHSIDNSKTSCPLDKKSSLLHVRSTHDALEINIEVLDQNKRRLHNITSLLIDWKFLQTNGAQNDNIKFNRESETNEIDGVAIPSRDYLQTSISEVSVNHKIKAIVSNYDEAVLHKLKIQPESPPFGIQRAGDNEMITPLIENELDFLAFDSSLLPFSSFSVFLSPGAALRKLQLGHGSGFYDIKVKHPSLLDVQHDKQSNEIILKPKQIGETTLEISDRCLKIEPSILHVSIVGIGKVELFSPDRVERTKSIEGIVKLYDSNDQLLDLDYENLNIYQLSEKVYHDQILSIKRAPSQENLQRGEIRYVINGNELGETKVVVTSGTVSSMPSPIQVFPPLQLHPRNATILVGSHLEISARGGPKSQSNVVYSLTNGDILAIDGDVVEGLKVGKSKVIGKSIGTNPIDGQATVFTEDFVFVNVIPLNRIKIKAPLLRLKSGSVMPITLWADTDISPMILGTLNLKIFWQIDSPDIIELKDVFDEFGVVYGENDAIAMRVRGLKQGKAKITAIVHHGSAKFQASIDVTVFKTLELELPKRIVHDPIIIPPRSSVQLKTNLDDTAYQVNEQGDKNIINVSKDGILRSFDILGTSLVVASSTSSDQKLDIPVEVKNVHYIMTSVVPKVHMRGLQRHLPKDLNFDMTISLHDNLGKKFSHNLDDIRWQLSNRDSVEINYGENFTMSVKLLRKGSSMMSVSLRDSSGIKHPQDFIKLAVKSGNGIFEEKIIATIGDIICFESPLNDALKWTSNSDSLDLHGSTGVITSVPTSQKVIVYHGDKVNAHISYEIQVKNPDRVQFLKKLNMFNGEAYSAHFIVSHHEQDSNKLTNILAINESFCENLHNNHSLEFVTCKLSCEDPNGIKKFEVSAIFDVYERAYACEIRPLASIEEITSFSRGKNINYQLEVRLQPSGVLDRINLRLTPAIQISPRQIHFDKLGDNDIIITGIESILNKVEVETSHPDSLILLPTIPKQVGRLQFKPKLQNAAKIDSDLFILIKSPATQQSIQIPILPASHVESEKQDEGLIMSFVSSTGKVVASTVLALALIGFFLMLFRNRDLDTSGGRF